MVCFKNMYTWTIPLITIVSQMFMQLFSKDALSDKNGWLDMSIERQFLCDKTIVEDVLSQKIA